MECYRCDRAWLITGQGAPYEGEAEAPMPDSKHVRGRGEMAGDEAKSESLKTINRLLDKNDKLEAKIERLEAKNDALEAELKRYREAAAQYDEKKPNQHRPFI